MPAGVGYGGLLSNPLLGASIGLLGASGPSPFPVGIGQALQGGLLGGRNAMGFGQDMQAAQQEQALKRIRSTQILANMQAEQQAAQQQAAQRDAIRRLVSPTSVNAPMAPPAAGLLAQQGAGGSIDGGGVFSPGLLRQSAPAAQPPPPQQLTPQQEQLRQLAEVTGDPKYAQAYADSLKADKDIELKRKMDYLTGQGMSQQQALDWLGNRGGTDVSVDVNTGRQTSPAGKKTTAELQAGLISDMNQLGELDTIINSYADSSLTLKGKFNLGASVVKDRFGKASPQERAEITRDTIFKQSVQSVFNEYRREITGAAAAVQELEQLEQSILNTKQSPTQFKAAFNNYRDKILRMMRIKRSILRGGVPIDGISEQEFGQRFDRLWVSGQDDDPDQRGEEIKRNNPGMTDEQIFDQLAQEGYGTGG